MTKHTPLPWKVYYAKNNGQIILGTGEENGCAIQNHSGAFWRDDEEAKANAEFVVRACNSHYELLEALEQVIDHCVRYFNLGDVGGDEAEILDNAKAAIAKARGQ